VGTPFSISAEHLPEGLGLVSVSGELDVDTAPQLGTCLTECGADGDRLVVLDLRGVTFMDSSALGTLVAGWKGFVRIGTGLRLVLDQPNLLRLFELSGLSEVFSISDTLEQALENA